MRNEDYLNQSKSILNQYITLNPSKERDMQISDIRNMNIYPMINYTETLIHPFWVYLNVADAIISYKEEFEKDLIYDLLRLNSEIEISLDYFIEFKDVFTFMVKFMCSSNIGYATPRKHHRFIQKIFLSKYKIEDEIILSKDFFVGKSENIRPDCNQLDILVKKYLTNIDSNIVFDKSTGEYVRKHPLMDDSIYSFFEYHFTRYKGEVGDFIKHAIELTQTVWKIGNPENRDRKICFDTWLKEKLVQYPDLDRSKLGLEPPQTTPESKQLNFIDRLNLWFRGLSYLGELIFPCSIPSDILYIEEEIKTNKELIAKYLEFISEYDVFTELQSFIISCDDKIKVDGLLRFVGNQVDGLERRYLKRFDESFGTDEYKNKFYGELKGSHNLYKLMNDYEYKVDMGIRMCNQVIFLYSPPSQSYPEPKPTTTSELIKLNYGANNDKIIQLLHVELNGIFIGNIDFKDFERHFKNNGAELKKMQWKGTQPEIIRLFTGLLPKHSTDADGSDLYGLKLDSDYEGYHQIVEHFYYLSRSKRDRTDFIYDNLTSKRSSETKRENTIRIHTILENIRNVVS